QHHPEERRGGVVGGILAAECHHHRAEQGVGQQRLRPAAKSCRGWSFGRPRGRRGSREHCR
ncbi:unnamed protein product, partial [Effrenium voratum]